MPVYKTGAVAAAPRRRLGANLLIPPAPSPFNHPAAPAANAASVKPVTPPWAESGAVLVCEKCYRVRIPEETPEIAERIGEFQLREWLKVRCREAGFGKRVRVIGTTCQDICAIGRVTVTILPLGARGELETFAIDPLGDREAIFQRIVDRLKSP